MANSRGPALYAILAGSALLIVTLVIGLITRDVARAANFLVPVSTLIVLGVVLQIAQRRKDSAWLREQWLMYNAQPRTAIATGVVLMCWAVFQAILGMAFIPIGYPGGWGLLLATAALGALIAFHVWVAFRPSSDIVDRDYTDDELRDDQLRDDEL